MNKARNLNQKNNKTRPPDARGIGKRILYPVLLVLFPFFFLGIFELALRLSNYGDSYDLFVDFRPLAGNKKMQSRIRKKYFYNFKYTSPPNDIFLKRNPVTDSGYLSWVVLPFGVSPMAQVKCFPAFFIKGCRTVIPINW
jgi:hypothetical protein